MITLIGALAKQKPNFVLPRQYVGYCERPRNENIPHGMENLILARPYRQGPLVPQRRYPFSIPDESQNSRNVFVRCYVGAPRAYFSRGKVGVWAFWEDLGYAMRSLAFVTFYRGGCV